MLNKKLIVVIAVILTAGFSVVTGCENLDVENNSTVTTTSPTVAVTKPASNQPATTLPVERIFVDQEALYQEFEEDPQTAMTKYEGKRLVFKNVLIEDMPWLYKGVGTDWYVINSYVKYKTMYLDYLNDLQVNYIVDIEGEVFGIQANLLIIEDCEYTIVDDSNGVEIPDYVFTF
ncbi:MAG: hypothetical protein JW954_00685 [Dehalococcoidaceae bacterium]|nr:hypothetical protein [Dehalococcoidaceae bacterium]